MIITPPTESTVIFIVPLKARARSQDWGLIERNFGDTARSVLASSSADFRLVVCGHDRPATLPEDARVAFLPAPFDLNDGIDSWTDKNWKLRHAASWVHGFGLASYIIYFLDADDLVSRHLVGSIQASTGEAWALQNGYRLDALSGALQSMPKAWRNCGSTFAARFRSEEMPRSFDGLSRFNDYQYCGRRIECAETDSKDLVLLQKPLVVYRINHPDSIQFSKVGAKTLRASREKVHPDDAVALLESEFSFSRHLLIPEKHHPLEG